MALSMYHLPILMMLSAILVVAGGEMYKDPSEEMGLTPSCINRVIATCGSSQSHSPLGSNCDSVETKDLVEALRESTSGQRAQQQVLEDLVKMINFQEFTISELQRSLINLELKIEKIDDSLTKMKEVNKPSLDVPRNCADLLKKGDTKSGIRTLYILTCSRNQSISVFCDQETDGGGWTVFQRRDDLPERENFFRSWSEYQDGFGNLTGELWLGLDNIHALVSATQMELRVDLEDFDGHKKWAKYDNFSIEDEAGKYRLHVGGYSGDAGDSLTYHNRRLFSTRDQDNNDWGGNCPEDMHGAWWYYSCAYSNLNGWPHEGDTSDKPGIYWYGFRNTFYYSLKKTEMKMRPKIPNSNFNVN